MVNSKKVLVLVMSFDKDPWRSIEIHGQRTTWAATKSQDPQVLFYYGVIHGPVYWSVASISKLLHSLGQHRLRSLFFRATGPRYALRARQTADRIVVEVPDIQGTISAKLVGAMRHVLKFHSFDYLFRTNTSSYVRLSLLNQFVQSLPVAGYYGGVLGQTLGLPFVSGAGILLSRDLVGIAAHDSNWDWDIMDDQALAKSMARAGVTPQAVARIEVSSPEQVALVSPEQWYSAFHVRCKSGGDRLQDIETMKLVHAAYLSARRA